MIISDSPAGNVPFPLTTLTPSVLETGTDAEAEMVIPWLGDEKNQRLTLKMAGGLKDEAKKKVKIFIETQFLKEFILNNDFAEYRIIIHRGKIDTRDKSRVTLKLISEPLMLKEGNIPSGIMLDWVKIETEDNTSFHPTR